MPSARARWANVSHGAPPAELWEKAWANFSSKKASQDLMLDLVYEFLSQTKRTRIDFEKIYAEDPDFQDVAKRLPM